ncbi:Type 1 glutamine amidotransferase-like domain-containing protein [Paenibacillus allorhizosphaerae]|uniref:Peptidase E n=1 Tax=Paenibacillus allorhizosphaerae TaxID=2849866 RepID=A0ABM8VHH9_9BACL|nr:Type 1 glutamine amidotransferase-like domain-containing protein [Paenibacillus allorhizosphaerae]CAG7642097.1 Peptidase E [Paenibacillus allorhizosphaerae]
MTAKAVFFIGGGSAQELESVYETMARYIKPSDHVLVIPFATEISRYEPCFDGVLLPFAQIGINRLSLLSIHENTETMIRKMESSQVLYFAGGLPDRLLERLEQKRIVDAIKAHSGILIGFSAGALAFCKDCIITKDEDYPQTKVVNGLGIVEFSVEVHYKQAIDEELYGLSDRRPIYALPNGSALHWNGSCMMPINQVIRFERGEKIECIHPH